jgi:hypothetical protein
MASGFCTFDAPLRKVGAVHTTISDIASCLVAQASCPSVLARRIDRVASIIGSR